MKAHIIGIGWVTAAGIGQGRRGDRFAMPQGALPAVSRKDIFSDPYPRFGRLDEFSRLGLAGIALALRDAGLDQWEQKRNIGICAGTTCGCLGTDMAYFDSVLPEGGALASPNLFAYTLSNTFLGEAAIRFGLTGSSFVLNDNSDGFSALRMALESITFAESTTMLAGFCDLPIPLDAVGSSKKCSGSVFLVLRDNPAQPGHSYAEITLDSDGHIAVNGHAMNEWSDLIQACLKTEQE